MKQFLTLCMAAAMIGTGFNANAKISLERAKELKAEGKMVSLPAMTRTAKATKALKNLKSAPVSQFHKLILDKDVKAAAQKAPAKVTAKGDNIYGYLIYSDDPDEMPAGLYEFQSEGASCLWDSDVSYSAVGLQDGVIKGYYIEAMWGMLFGIYYVETDFATGEILDVVEQDLDSNTNYIQTGTLNTDTEEIYGFGGFDGAAAFIKAPTSDPTNYSVVSYDTPNCISICYNAVEKAFYGVTSEYEFVKIDTNGDATVLTTLDVPNGALYITGLVYDELSNVYYWNINDTDELSYMATIDGSTYDLDIYETCALGEEYSALFTTDVKGDPMKPGKAVALDADFYKESLIGFVNFQLPDKFAEGNALPEEIGYRTYVDGELYSAGTAKAGSVLKANFAVPQGMHTFALAVVVKYTDEEGVQKEAVGSMASIKKYVGYDNPIAASNVILTDTEVTWTPYLYTANGEGEGVHAGYVDPKSVYYVVTVNGQVAGETEPGEDAWSMNVSDFIKTDEELAAYQATVVAVANGLESSVAYSNKIAAGQAFTLPMYITPTADEFALCTIVDNNEDGRGWSYAQGQAQTNYTYSKDVPMDDWLFLPPFAIEDVTKFYSFSCYLAARSATYSSEWVEVLLCNEPSPRGVVGTIVEEFQPVLAGETVEELFRVRQAGDYYIAIHCTSDGDQMGIVAKDFAVEDNNVSFASPAAVENLTAVAGEQGALNATVSFTMPTMTFGEQPLAEDAEVTASIKVNGLEVATVTDKPGAEVSEVVETAQGNNTITVTTSMGELNGLSEKVEVYTGVDVPATVDYVDCVESPDMLSMTLSWPAVTKPYEEGGIINPENVVYDIYAVVQTIFGASWGLYEQGITDTTYTYTVEEGAEQDMVQLGVVARNEAGDCGYLKSAMGILGTPLALPIVEDFEDENALLQSQPWITYAIGETQSGQYQWGFYSNEGNFEGGVEGGTSMVCQGVAGAITRLGSPRFSTKGMTAAAFNITVNDCFYLPKVTIYAQKYGQDAEAIGEVVLEDPEATEGLHTFNIELPAEYLGQDWVGIFIEAEFEDGLEVLVIEDMSITGTSGVKAVSLGNVKIEGGKNVINVSGLNGQDVMISTIDGRIAAKASKVSNNAAFNLEKGVYVVKAGDKEAKVVVK
ncbi:MAG: hypothetical protein K2K93_05725 [Muribaculaceae bacterium]|nr:hypothetical protein [Muribaculaceae bacterium]